MVLIEVKEAAARLKMSVSTVRGLCDQKKLIAIRPSGNPNGKRLVVAESLDKYLQTLVDGQQPKTGFVPQVVHWDDSERELTQLINNWKKRKRG